MDPTEPGIKAPLRDVPLPPSLSAATWMPGFEFTPLALETLAKPIQRCVERIRSLLADEIQGATVQVICQRPGDRINLALTVDEKPIAFNFVSEEECQGAYDVDPEACSPIDHFTRNWIRVARVKLNDSRSVTDFSPQALAMVAQARAARQTA